MNRIALALTLVLSFQVAYAERSLTATLYPIIPDREAFYWSVQKEFQAKYPEIRLTITLNDDYYDEEKGILNEVADVYEIDSVLMPDMIKKGKARPLTGLIDNLDSKDFVPPASVIVRNKIWYGYPHWACSNFLFIGSVAGQQHKPVRTLSELEGLLKPERSHGLIIDLKGRSTLGELYLDSLMDQFGDEEEALARVGNEPDASTLTLFHRVQKLTVPRFGRNQRYHDSTGFYARQFARRQGRAFVGYSESLHFVHKARSYECEINEKCLTEEEIQVAEWPMSATGSHPIAWIDSLAIDQRLEGQKLADAVTFVRFLASSHIYRKALLPAFGQSPRYLIPALLAPLDDPDIVKAAPLYSQLRPIIWKSRAVYSEGLNRRLRKIGGELNKRLPE
ncbi:MAG: hypothetical protein JNM27_08645 [Leptospirales bacterium]|nr:hypothetical protein [Leptospirales bacterium]